jgi:hypothetical protein
MVASSRRTYDDIFHGRKAVSLHFGDRYHTYRNPAIAEQSP